MELFFLLLTLSFCALLWQVAEWADAKAGEAAERTRSMKLDNDRKQLELERMCDD